MSDGARHFTKLPAEQEAIKAKCIQSSGIFTEFKKDEIEHSFPERFDKIVRLYVRRIVLSMNGTTLTYAQLDAASNRAAWKILEKLGNTPEPVLLLFERRVQAIVAMLGALKTCTFYVPVNASWPSARVALILEDSKAKR